MFVVATSIILVLIGVVALIGAQRTRNPKGRASLTGGGAVALGLAVVVVILGMVTTVGANKVGVVTSVGRYQGVIQSGFHMLAPWTDVEEFGTRIQPLTLTDVPVRFEGNSGGDADLLIEWRIEAANEPAVRQMWSDYRTMAAVEDRLVRYSTVDVLNTVLAGYEPGLGINGASREPITAATLTKVRERLAGKGVVVDRITILYINPDPASQKRIDGQVQAATDKQIAETQAETARIRSGSEAAKNLQLECLRIAEQWDQAKQGPVPGAWNCNFGGPSAPVLVGGR